MEFYDKHVADRDRFEVLAFHDDSVQNFEELDENMKTVIEQNWNGKNLPFPILLDASGATVKTYGIQAYPTLLLIDPEGRMVKGGNEEMLEKKFEEARGK